MGKYTVIGERMKRYERTTDFYLPPRTPVLIRVDGRAFHTWTRRADRPFDRDIAESMVEATIVCAKEMAGFRLAYHQSDEVTFVLLDTATLQTQPWFDNRLSKLASVTASMFTAAFNAAIHDRADRTSLWVRGPATFDARVFPVPLDDTPNVFVWRQRDWRRNSITMLASALCSHRELHGRSTAERLALCRERGRPWENLDPWEKYGTFVSHTDWAWVRMHAEFGYEALAELITTVDTE